LARWKSIPKSELQADIMLRLEKITSLDRPELEPYRTLKRSGEHAALGIFVVEGDKVLIKLLESNFTVISLLIIEERFAEFEAQLRARPEKEIAIFTCEKKLLSELVGFDLYQGVLAIAKIPKALSLEKILTNSSSPRFLVAMDGMSNAENVGTIMRNCAALGVQALIASERCSDLFLRRTVRNSMGTVFRLPTLKSTNLVETLRALRAQGIRCIVAHPHTDKKLLSQADFSGDCCVVLGSEGHGISPEVLAACDEAVAIPMTNDVDSLNVSAAAAVFLYEVNRQRGQA
jgi:tRNA G18 (ribose-2'-O)-methylase SpoU